MCILYVEPPWWLQLQASSPDRCKNSLVFLGLSSAGVSKTTWTLSCLDCLMLSGQLWKRNIIITAAVPADVKHTDLHHSACGSDKTMQLLHRAGSGDGAVTSGAQRLRTWRDDLEELGLEKMWRIWGQTGQRTESIAGFLTGTGRAACVHIYHLIQPHVSHSPPLPWGCCSVVVEVTRCWIGGISHMVVMWSKPPPLSFYTRYEMSDPNLQSRKRKPVVEK